MGLFCRCSQAHSHKHLTIDNPRSLNESEFETDQSLTETRITRLPIAKGSLRPERAQMMIINVELVPFAGKLPHVA